MIGLDLFLPQLETRWGGPRFLGILSLGFLAIYLVQHTQWWAIIPGGSLLTLAVVAGLDVAQPGMETGALFFIGLALTFGLRALAPTSKGHMTWARIPAGIAAAIGVAVMAAATAVLDVIWSAALIAAGAYLLYRTRRSRRDVPDRGQPSPRQADAPEEHHSDHSLSPR